MKIGYLGPEGTFTHQAAIKFSRDLENHSLIAVSSIRDCLLAVDRDEIDYGVVPIENSIEGTVTFTIDSLIFDVDVVIEEELILPIRHCLAIKKDVKKNEVKKILSHPQALAQCRKNIAKEFNDIEMIQLSSTALAAHSVSESSEPLSAICTKQVAQGLGLEIINEDMQDEEHNETRFLIVSKRGRKTPLYEGKTTIVFGTDDKPGELYRILDIIAIWDLNMTKIESRPRKNELGSYVFYIDFESKNPDDIRDALKMIERKTKFFKHLGTYKTL